MIYLLGRALGYSAVLDLLGAGILLYYGIQAVLWASWFIWHLVVDVLLHPEQAAERRRRARLRRAVR
jgi:hypothetical protein